MSPAEDAGPGREVVEGYRRSLPPGEELEFEVTGLDHVGLPVWSAALWPEGGPFANGVGYGTSRAKARTSAYGELFEAAHAWRTVSGMARTRGSYDGLVVERGPRGVVDPAAACLPAGSPYTTRTELEWVEARRWPEGEAVLVPVEFAATRFADLSGSPSEPLITPITNGLGAGPSVEHALSHALLELVQRDGNSVSYRALDRGVAVDLDEVRDPETRDLLDLLDRSGVDVVVKLAATDFGMANLYAVGEDRDPSRASHPLVVTACGEAAHPDRERALKKCLAEYCASRARKPFNHGPLDPIEELAPAGYLDHFRQQPLGSEEDRSLEATLDWLSRSYDELRALISDPILTVRSRQPFSGLPAPGGPESAEPGEELLRTVAGRLRSEGLDVLYVDLSPEAPAGGARAVKAIVPGLEVETLSYGRIGARNLRRLLERESELIATGEPGGRPGARKILLPEEEEKSLGPAWLDWERVESVVGELYPLYREPGRHVAALAAERQGLA